MAIMVSYLIMIKRKKKSTKDINLNFKRLPFGSLFYFCFGSIIRNELLFLWPLSARGGSVPKLSGLSEDRRAKLSITIGILIVPARVLELVDRHG